MFWKRVTRTAEKEVRQYDGENQRPVIRASICTGEQVAGFKDIRTGKFEEVMALKSAEDLRRFLALYQIEEKDIRKEY